MCERYPLMTHTARCVAHGVPTPDRGTHPGKAARRRTVTSGTPVALCLGSETRPRTASIFSVTLGDA